MTNNYSTVKRLCFSLFISLVLAACYIYNEPLKRQSSVVKLDDVLASVHDRNKQKEIMAIVNGKLQKKDCFGLYKENDLRAICYLIRAREEKASLTKLDNAKKAKKYVDLCVHDEPRDNYLRILRAFIYTNLPSRLVDTKIISQDLRVSNIKRTP